MDPSGSRTGSAPEGEPGSATDGSALGQQGDPVEVLRELPGRRVERRGDEVHKLFLPAGPGDLPGRLRAVRRARREASVLAGLADAGLPVPRLLAVEALPGGGRRLRLARVPGPTAEEALAACTDEAATRALLADLADLLARLWATGLDHGDLHGGNVVVGPDGPVALDFQAARLARPVTAARVARDLAVLDAAWRERLGPVTRARALVAVLAALAVHAPGLAVGPRRDLADRVALFARRRRRAELRKAAGPGGRWRRVSGATRAPGDTLPRGADSETLFARTVPAHDEPRLRALCLGDGPLPPDLERVVGAGAEAAWALAVRAAGHALPGPRPLLLDRGGPEARALVGLPAGAVSTAALALPPGPDERASLAALLAERGLALGASGPAAYRRHRRADGTTVLALAPGARLVDLPLDAAEEAAAARRRAAHLAARERRARCLDRLPLLAAPALRPVTAAGLALAAGAARWSPLEARLRRHLTRGLPDRDPVALARGVRRHMARQAAELARIGRGPAREGAWVDEHVALDDSVARLDELRAAGRGVLLVTPHLGSWELLAIALRRRGLEGAVVARRRLRDPGGDWLERLRARWDVTSLPQDTPPRDLLRRLARGEVIGILPDLEVPRLAGLRLDVLGHDALVMTAPAALARAARLPLLPARCVWRGDRYEASFGPVLDLPVAEDGRPLRDPRPLTEAWLRVFEAWIREDPEQWIWYHDRWRTPPGPADGVPLAALRAAQRP